MLYKNILLKIKKSFGRYISLLIITLVGVGFYAGIQAVAPDIFAVTDKYYTAQTLMDFKIVSTMGLTDDDVVALSELENVKQALGSYSLDAISGDNTIRIHAIEEYVNRFELIEGRMPENRKECVADSKNYSIGDVIEIKSDVSDDLRNSKFTVVGLINSALYVSSDYGSSTVGEGKLNSYIFIDRKNFKLDVYTEIYIIMDGSIAYSDKYESLSKELREQLDAIKADREDARYMEIFNEANDKIKKNEKKIDKKEADGKKKLKKAKSGLDDSVIKLQDGKDELWNNEQELDDTVYTKTEEFKDAKEKISDGWNEIDTALKKNNLTRNNVDEKATELKKAIDRMKKNLSQIPKEMPEHMKLATTIEEYSNQYEGLLKLMKSIDELKSNESKLNEGIETFNSEIYRARAEIGEAWVEIAENERELQDGRDEYDENLKEFKIKIADARKKIKKAKKKLDDIERPKWNIFDREVVVGYDDLDNDVGVVASIALVFPLFFIAIVMLMTSNTMARMIAEERSELGTFTSLGYTNRKIIGTYLIYVLSSTGIGALLGFFIGTTFFPPMIFSNFDYRVPSLEIQYDYVLLLIILLVVFVLMTSVTVFSCYQELGQRPAALLRPLPPSNGKKILLERIPLIWNRFSFTWKVTIRNMFRYKKRGLMIIIGVAGCSALMLVGFGLRDSMDGLVDKQYGEIFKYDNMIVLKDEVPSMKKDLRKLLKEKKIDKSLLLKQSAVKSIGEDIELESYIIVPEDTENKFLDFYNLKVLGLNKGGNLTVKDNDNNRFESLISDVVENYIGKYIYINSELYEDIFNEKVKFNIIVSIFDGDEDLLAKNLIENDQVLGITFTSDIAKKALDMNARLNSIIVLIVVVASILAFAVLYNLASINISERNREIATLKVLGFRDNETNSYIYREAIILTFISIGIGLLLGIGIHRFVVEIIEGTLRTFFKDIHWISFVLAGSLTIIFSLIMQLITYFKLRTVDMIDSLKSVE